MHFAKCRNNNVLNGCPQTQHGHIWDDDRETHDLVLNPLLSTKKVARKLAEHTVKLVYPFGREKEAAELLGRLIAEIDATDLPDEFPSVRQVRRVSLLMLIK